MAEKLQVTPVEPTPPAAPPLPALEFSVSALAVSFVADFVDAKESRPAMQFMHLQPHPDGGVMVAATNGAALALFHDQYGSANRPGSATLSARMKAACHASAKALVRRSTLLASEQFTPHHQMTVRNGRLCCTSYAEETHVDPLVLREDGTPTWEIPRGTELFNLGQVLHTLLHERSDQVGPRGLMQPGLMTMVCKAFDRLGQPLTEKGILMHQPDPDSMNYVFQPVQDKAFIVMMPMRGYDQAAAMDVQKNVRWVLSLAKEGKGLFS